jgi:hypothetical protein
MRSLSPKSSPALSLIEGSRLSKQAVRTWLSWSVCRLASAASVRQHDIDNFEVESCVPKAATLGAIRRALEARGVVFLPDDGVRGSKNWWSMSNGWLIRHRVISEFRPL